MNIIKNILIMATIFLCACEPAEQVNTSINTPLSASVEFKSTMRIVSPLILQGRYYQAQTHLLNAQGYLRGTEFFYQSQYWLGECSLSLAQYDKSVKYFYSSYTGSLNKNIQASSVEGLARAYYLNHNYSQASKYIKLLARQYPYQSDRGQISQLQVKIASKNSSPIKQPKKNQFKKVIFESPKTLTVEPGLYIETGNKKYYLQCGIFSQKKNSTALIQKLKWNGFSPFTIEKENGKVYVMLGYYSSKRQAVPDYNKVIGLGINCILKP